MLLGGLISLLIGFIIVGLSILGEYLSSNVQKIQLYKSIRFVGYGFICSGVGFVVSQVVSRLTA